MGRPIVYTNWLRTGESDLEQATFIFVDEFPGAVLVAEMDLRSCAWLAQPIKADTCYGFDLAHEFNIAFDIAIGLDLNLHKPVLPFWILPPH